VIAERERAEAALPALSGLFNNPVRLSREGRAANSTFNAVLYALRKGGKAALNEQAERLQQFSDRQIKGLIRHLNKAGVDDQLLIALAELLP
jgi:hypothetical protein